MFPSRLMALLALATLSPGTSVPGRAAEPAACADVNGDASIDVQDGIALLDWLFRGSASLVCVQSASCGDINGDVLLNVADPVYLFRWLFQGGPEPRCGPTPAEFEGFAFLAENTQGYPEYVHELTGIVFVLLPGGSFEMGSPDDECERVSHEGPVHPVTLGPFLLAKDEVSQAEWERTMGSNPSFFDGTNNSAGQPASPAYERGLLPVEQVSWSDVQDFESRTGLRLPTEAQWEYACRAGSASRFALGNGRCLRTDQANFEGAEVYCHPECATGIERNRTVPVGSFPPNAFGLHDLIGNVGEWCEDVWDPGFYSRPEASEPDPIAGSGSSSRVCRGCSWVDGMTSCRSAVRWWLPPDVRSDGLGFRPALYPLP